MRANKELARACQVAREVLEESESLHELRRYLPASLLAQLAESLPKVILSAIRSLVMLEAPGDRNHRQESGPIDRVKSCVLEKIKRSKALDNELLEEWTVLVEIFQRLKRLVSDISGLSTEVVALLDEDPLGEESPPTTAQGNATKST